MDKYSLQFGVPKFDSSILIMLRLLIAGPLLLLHSHSLLPTSHISLYK
jgi:hypothetical protein